jgi:hypothetical protein
MGEDNGKRNTTKVLKLAPIGAASLLYMDQIN